MKKLTLFHLTHCPYCHNARRALEELTAEDVKYAAVPVDWIEESEQPQVASQYDYYYVPTIFDGQTKLYEAKPGESYEDCKRQVRAALEAAMNP